MLFFAPLCVWQLIHWLSCFENGFDIEGPSLVDSFMLFMVTNAVLLCVFFAVRELTAWNTSSVRLCERRSGRWLSFMLSTESWVGVRNPDDSGA
jgi:hypothetical protein